MHCGARLQLEKALNGSNLRFLHCGAEEFLASLSLGARWYVMIPGVVPEHCGALRGGAEFLTISTRDAGNVKPTVEALERLGCGPYLAQRCVAFTAGKPYLQVPGGFPKPLRRLAQRRQKT